MFLEIRVSSLTISPLQITADGQDSLAEPGWSSEVTHVHSFRTRPQQTDGFIRRRDHPLKSRSITPAGKVPSRPIPKL